MVDKVYVTMTDKFMSKWGLAKGQIHKFIVECDTLEQAKIIEKNAYSHEEMKYIRICSKKPKYNSQVYTAWTTFKKLGITWKK